MRIFFFALLTLCTKYGMSRSYKEAFITINSAYLFQSDTVTIKHKRFILTIYKSDTAVYFIVQKWVNGQYKTIIRDDDYITNNSGLHFIDANKDGYLDIVWTKKWQDHAYLFNPNTENFVEVGEFHDIDTLKINSKAVLYKSAYPLLYYMNEEKPMRGGVENHSELFCIDSNYHKISFAIIDNFSTDDASDDLIQSGQQISRCFVPPYRGKYNTISIWNDGRTVDSLITKRGTYLDKTFARRYWQNNYHKVLQYGRVFYVRRSKALKYY